jgi:uncharacterized protein (DUF305 family)
MKVSIFLTFGFVVVALLFGVGIGYFVTPEYKVSMYQKNTMDLGLADRTLDLRYINAMIAHHKGAILLAEQLQKNTTRPEMKTLAGDILGSEPKAIDELYAWKKSWYGDTRTVQDPIVANLGPAGDTFDLRFLNAIIAHHELGILMTRDVRTKSSRAEVLNNADAVEAFLSGGIEMLKGFRKNWYSI